MPSENCLNLHDICSNCEECITCGTCDCERCSCCGNLADAYCPDCDYCLSCCSCEHTRVRHEGGPLAFLRSRPLDKYKNPITRCTSLEIEIARVDRNINIKSAADYWDFAIVGDGSLPDGGFEINTMPASGQKFIDQLRAIAEALNEDGAQVDRSCGLHNHVDCRDLTWYDMRKVILLWMEIESAIYMMVPKARRENHYCLPIRGRFLKALECFKMPHASKVALMRTIYGTGLIKSLKQEKYHESRYSVLNVHSWVYRGSLEFRLPPGTTVFDKFYGWASLFNGIVNFAMMHSERDLWAYKDYIGQVELSKKLLYQVAEYAKCKPFVERRLIRFANSLETEG